MNDIATFFESIELNQERFVSLLGSLIGETRFLQNNPAQGLIPQEVLRYAKYLLL